MEKLEKVEKLREKTGVTYEEAKNALEACEYDVLDALVYLETLGKIQAPKNATYSTSAEPGMLESESFSRARTDYEEGCRKNSVGSTLDKFFDWCGKVIKKGWESKFIVYHHDEVNAEIPVLVLVIALLFAFWIVLPLLFVGLFFDFKYQFKGIGKMTVDLNEMCDKASEACVNVKDKKDE